MGEPVTVSLNIANMGQTTVDLEKATISTNNGEIMEGETVQLEPLKADDDTALTQDTEPDQPDHDTAEDTGEPEGPGYP